MNDILQNILVFSAVIAAIGFLVKSFFFKKVKSEKACGTDKNCGCD